jgi:glycosyltransferase involved in cell wall biosynthesis
MPAVSVIMPAFNVAPYIGEAIESVLGQTFADLELLVVDDGSTDGTEVVAEGYAARDSRVRVIRQTNGGISTARNRALRIATSPVIAILDSDDAWDPAYLRVQMAILDTRANVDVVTGNAWFLGGSQNGRPARPWPDLRPAPTLADMLADETAVFIMSIFRRRVYEAIGPFDEGLRTNEDYDFWLRAACANFVFHRNDQPLGYYRRRDNSLSADELRMVPGILRVFRKARPVLHNRPVELAILDAQIIRFETEYVAAEARGAIESGDFAAASLHLTALHQIKGGALLRLARFMARWTPSLLSTAYNVRRARLALSRAARQRVA